MVRDNVAINNARFIPDRSHRSLGSRHRSSVTSRIPLIPITLIIEVYEYCIIEYASVRAYGLWARLLDLAVSFESDYLERYDCAHVLVGHSFLDY